MSKVEMCQFYSVKMFPKGGFMAKCGKGRRAGIKCHTKRTARGCPDYKPSGGLTDV